MREKARNDFSLGIPYKIETKYLKVVIAKRVALPKTDFFASYFYS